MYESGKLEIGETTDTQTEHYDSVFGAYLPHSCDEWVIGGPEQIRMLIMDLQEALKKLEEAKKP